MPAAFSATFQVVGFCGQAAGDMKKQTKTYYGPYELTARQRNCEMSCSPTTAATQFKR